MAASAKAMTEKGLEEKINNNNNFSANHELVSANG